MKILITDDSKMARKMLLKAIKEQLNDGVYIEEAVNGEEAFEKYKELNPDICFMDLTMPVLNGFDATKKICEYDNEAKIIIISADIQEASMQKAKDNGAIGFIKKPVNSANLEKMLIKIGIKS